MTLIRRPTTACAQSAIRPAARVTLTVMLDGVRLIRKDFRAEPSRRAAPEDPMTKPRRIASALVVVAASLVAPMPAAAASPPAPGAPGTPSFFDPARKECVGTARNATSKVWFTVAG